MKRNFFAVFLLMCVGVSVANAQESATSESKIQSAAEKRAANRLAALEKQRDKAQIRLDKAKSKKDAMDSTKSQSAALIEEGKREQAEFLKEKEKIDKTTLSQMKARHKSAGENPEALKDAEQDIKAAKDEYRSTVEELKKRFNAAQLKVTKGEKMVSGPFAEKYRQASEDLKNARAALRDADKLVIEAQK